MDWVAAAVITMLAAAGMFMVKTLVVGLVILLIKLAVFMLACVVGIMAFLGPDS